MIRKHVHSNRGISLTEALVVVSIIAILLAISIPAARELSRSLDQSMGAVSIIDAALANARAIAIREQRYAGVRFQQDLQGNQFLTFIVHDPAATRKANGFRAVNGKKPMALPEAVGVIADGVYTDAKLIAAGGMNDETTFSMIFNASGRFVTHTVQVFNKDGKTDDTSTDKIFNTPQNVRDGKAQFIQDSSAVGYEPEDSVAAFRIYDKRELQKTSATPWTGYLRDLDRNSINLYTGELIKK
ncbi:MAG: prepilin-type N-terminal cleavage/methylation domain-containing protein [Anaerohalosphaeraceae bacterium]